MSKHHSADEKLVSSSVRKQQLPPVTHLKDFRTAPQIGKPKTNSKNQYR
jgi:hypothetical protein